MCVCVCVCVLCLCVSRSVCREREREREIVLPFPHAFLQIGQQELAVESVYGGDVGKDALDHVPRECALVGLLQ